MQIKCPECGAKFTLGQPKPGRYKPKCKQCGKPFILQVSDGDPPKVAVGKLKPKAAGQSKSSAAKPASTTKVAGASKAASPKQADKSAVEATLDSVAASATVGSVDATMDSASASQTTGNTDATVDPVAVSGGVDATMDTGASQTAGDMEATMDSVAGQQPSASQTAGGADATMDSSTAGSAQAANSVSAGASQTRRSTVRAGGSSKAGSVKAGASKAPAAANKPAGQVAQLPDRLGGYKIMRELGRGAMGAVYEAKQISLDRLVALKTIRGRLAENAASLARFTREAYAAAQLTHHNVVQIYDFGEDAGKHFFSMEWVRGGPLSDLIRDKGPLEPKLAVGYTLQAARGLQFAHRHGMVHRDVKPANLLLSDEGVVKVADLGLVKIPDQIDPDPEVGTGSVSGLQSGTQVTMQGTAVGTPAYMAPEQGIDAASVDHRADIYSLGCSLFYLLAGKPPFDGSDVSEVLEQHAKQQPPDLTAINARISGDLQRIVHRSMAKQPEDRYGSLSEMITDMESYLGINAEGDFSPSSAQADQWEAIVKSFNGAAPLSRLSAPAFLGFAALCILLTIVMPLKDLSWLLVGPMMFVTGVLTAILMGGGGRHSAIADTLRRWLSSLSWFDYAVAGFGVLVFLLAVFAAGVWPGLVVGMIVGAIAGAVYHFALVAPSRSAQSGPVIEAEKFIRDLRIKGAEEDGIRSFTARYAGKNWQGIYETLFGYQALCKMRDQMKTDRTFTGSTKFGLRDRVIGKISAKADANQQAHDHKRLAKIEERGLASEGVSAQEAHERALQMASAIIEDAKQQAAAIAAAGPPDAKAAVEAKRARQKEMLAEARSGKYAKQRDPLAPVKFALGGQTRLLAGCILLGIFAIGVGLVDTSGNVGDLESVPDEHKPMGIAGVLLVMSSFVSGWRMTPFALVATLVILFGTSLGIPSFTLPVFGDVEPWMVATVVGVLIYVPGVLFGETQEYE